MTPQMQQSIKLLQMNSMELEQLTEQQMLENPYLEIRDDRESSTNDNGSMETEADQEKTQDIEMEEGREKDLEKEPEAFDRVDIEWEDVYNYAENKVYYQREKYEEHDFTEYTSYNFSLIEDLKRQVRLSALKGKEVEIADYIIGCLDDDGYLHADLDEIAGELKVTREQVEDVLDIVQSFDPPGVAARDLAESLRLQLEDQDVRDSFIYVLIDDHLDELQKKRFKDIARKMDVDEERVIDAFHRISRLEPKPGQRFNHENPQYIRPDVFVKKIEGKYMYYLNEGRSSHLSLNPFYIKLLNNSAMSKKEKEYALEKYRGAVWLLKNIEKRKTTILRITEAIMEAQKEFLEKGLSHLKPLTLREVAEEVEMHESTVARVTTGKYVETPRGTYELKFFFSSGLGTRNGESTSSTSVKQMIARIIEDEPPQKPLSDQKIADKLKKKGIKIARRTVAKYREQMRILPAKLRKKAKSA